MDGLAVDGMRGSGAYDLVLEWALAKIKDHEDPPEMESPGVVLVTVALLETLHVRVGHIIDEMHLAGAQGGQTDRVLALGLADNLVKIGQVVPFSIGFPVVLETYQSGFSPARPGDKLEWACADGVFSRLVEIVRRLQVDRVVHEVDGQRDIWLMQIEAHR